MFKLAQQDTQPVTDTEWITPAKAEKWLERNRSNRNVSKKAVERLTGAIRRGEWIFNGASIVFDSDGWLLDGQHRLHAIALSGNTVQSNVTRGVEVTAQFTMDSGGRGSRTLADALSMRGETNASLLAGALVYLFRDVNGVSPRHSTYRPTITQGLALLDQHPDLRNSTSIGKGIRNRLKANPSLMTYLHYRFTTIDPEDGADYFDRLATGEELYVGHPIYTLREVLVKDAAATKRLTKTFVHAYAVKAWNAYRLGEDLKLLRWRAGGSRPESFPEPI